VVVMLILGRVRAVTRMMVTRKYGVAAPAADQPEVDGIGRQSRDEQGEPEAASEQRLVDVGIHRPRNDQHLCGIH